QGNYIGTNAAGTSAVANLQSGVLISGGATNNTVGGTTAAARNIISGNFDGVQINAAGTSGNVVAGNYIRTDVTGSLAVSNNIGVGISGAPNNTIGGPSPGAGNVISGNTALGFGAVFIDGSGGDDNVIRGNFIGTDPTGTVRVANLGSGVYV